MLWCVFLVGTQRNKKLTHDVTQFTYKVRSGKFGHQVNSDMHLIRIFTVCFVNIFLHSNN